MWDICQLLHFKEDDNWSSFINYVVWSVFVVLKMEIHTDRMWFGKSNHVIDKIEKKEEIIQLDFIDGGSMGNEVEDLVN